MYHISVYSGGYFVRTTRTSTQGKMTRTLQSPQFQVNEISCLHFYYFGQSSSSGFKTIAVVTSGDVWSVIWRIHGIVNNRWHKGRASISQGTYKLLFLISGDQYRGGIDDVALIPGQCPTYSKSFHRYTLHYTSLS